MQNSTRLDREAASTYFRKSMIDYEKELNPAQLEAATTVDGPVLVIAGAGSGKTRTIVFRLAHLVQSGVPASNILLLTFTRKAAQEMLARARVLLGHGGMPALSESPAVHAGGLSAGLAGVHGGTFHAFAFSVLRLFRPEGFGQSLSVMDSHDILSTVQHCKEELKLGKGDKSFPKNQTIVSYLSKSRNKEQLLEDVLRREAQHLLPHAEAIDEIGRSYALFKKEKSLLDYDDLLFELDKSLEERPEVLDYCQSRFKYIMVDEYQDTNPVQARIAGRIARRLPLEGREGILTGNIMVVGDDAQSIYAFRGADVRNILGFPEAFPDAKVIRLEENYRSTQPVLSLANAVLEHAAEGFQKRLFTRRPGGIKPNVIRPFSDLTQAGIAAGRIAELLQVYPPEKIAVLFRAGFHSYHLEVHLNKMGIRFRKYGGIKYTEAAHVKDAMSFVRLVLNPLDYTAFARMAELSKGVGAKTCLKIYRLVQAGDTSALGKATGRFPDLAKDLAFLDGLRSRQLSPSALLSQVIDHYQPRLEELYPDDYPRRQQGLEELAQIAAVYQDLDLLVADLSLDEPAEAVEENDAVVLSTIHSAKGLEWPAVLVLDLVEERFPSRHAMTRPADYEEERRLMYVACTRAMDSLDLFVPSNLYERGSGGAMPAVPSPFIRELSPELYTEWQESYTGALVEKQRIAVPESLKAALGKGAGLDDEEPVSRRGSASAFARQRAGKLADRVNAEKSEQDEEYGLPAGDEPDALGTGKGPAARPEKCGYCTHKIFGRGKIVQHLPPDKYRVNFPGIGLKVIMGAFLSMEDK